MAFKPSAPFNVAMRILKPVGDRVLGVLDKAFSTPSESDLFYGSFKTFGGTERLSNDVYTIVNTATIDTWYRPDIKADCRIYICDTGDTYEIVADPEDVDFRHQYMRIKVKKAGGKP